MDERPIGFLDSGLGGISILGEAVRLLPKEHFLYYGDTAHMPYGDKTPQEVLSLVRNAVSSLLQKQCKAIVIACNTATGVAAAALREELSVPIIGIEPALKPASLLPGEGKIAVLATSVTLVQDKFRLLMDTYCPDALLVPCPGLMEYVEQGILEGPEVDGLLEQLLLPCRNQKIKAVVMGCTHYPFLKQTIAKHFSSETVLLDGGAGTARQLCRKLEEYNLLNTEGPGSLTFSSSAEGEEPIRRMKEMFVLWQNRNGKEKQK